MSGSKWKAEVGMGNGEWGIRSAECGKYKHGAKRRGQRTEDRRQTTEVRGQKTEDRSQMTEVRQQIKTDMRRLGRLKI